MDTEKILDAQIQTKRIQTLLGEIIDLTQQMIEAADRGDEITIQLLLGMRAEPIEKMALARKALEQQRDTLPALEGKRLAQLLNGEDAVNEQERPLANQVKNNRMLLEKAMEYDRRLSFKIAKEDSFYEKDLRKG